ncbi:rhomboid family intramembrane serine protease [Streptomyces sp. NPDC001380]|uniref:rhomboid family intramembrane serine protease n=1 Tax=Streptomyces sp. NPDC001380 TaxID=3364566 RepID=UPI0036AB8874
MGERVQESAGTGPGGADLMVAEARKAFFVMFALLAAVWLVQLANWQGDYALSRDHGVVPGELGRLPDVLAAPFLHWSWAHIESNSGPLFVFGFLAAYRGVARFAGLTLLVTLTSGLAVWLFERGGVDTVGASGLVFGYFGYVVVRGLFDRHLVDTLVGVVMAASFAYLLTVAVPGTPGVSWLGHLGGLAGGVLGAWVLRTRRPRAAAAGGSDRSGGSGGSEGGTTGPGAGPAGRSGPPARADGPRADLYKELGDLGLL